MFERAELKSLLLNHEAQVSFIKKDGTKRKMKCTLKPNIIVYESGATSTRIESPEVLSVWDIEKEGWRSFRLDSVKKITFTFGD